MTHSMEVNVIIRGTFSCNYWWRSCVHVVLTSITITEKSRIKITDEKYIPPYHAFLQFLPILVWNDPFNEASTISLMRFVQLNYSL